MRVRRRAGLAVFALIVALRSRLARGLGQAVDRIDPPSWWVDRQDQRVNLLVEGSGLRGAEVRVTRRGPVRVERVDPGDDGRAVRRGDDPGRISTRTLRARCRGRKPDDPARPGRPSARPAGRPEPFGPDDVIYLAMPDRFSDGDPGNNESEPGRPAVRPARHARLPRRGFRRAAPGSPTWSTWASRRSG